MANRFIWLVVLLSMVAIAHAAGDMTAQKPIEVKVRLGDKHNRLQFYPNSLQFETGKLYKLVISNPSKQKHYFISEAMSRSVFTRKVEIINRRANTVAEVKGSVSEIEVYPGGVAEWWFVPIKTINTARLHCSIKGHAEAGMSGSITIR